VSTQQYQGRLELTWTNKDLCLLAHEDGTYQWTPKADYRVAEVRLLHDAGTMGQVEPERMRARDNLLICGDALNALRSLTSLPEFAREHVGKVKLAYLDPPFNTKQSFLHYDDALEHSVWLTMMRDRLRQVEQLLSEDGSVWVHCDDSEQAYLKAMMDEVFGRPNFVTAFIWQKVDSPNDNKVAITPDHDYILCYSKNPGAPKFRKMPDPSILAAYGGVADDGRHYRDRLLKKNGRNSLRRDRPSMFFPIPGPDGVDVYPIHDDGREACWAAGEVSVRAWLTAGKIVWKRRDAGDGAQKWVPYTREWAPSLPTRPWPTIWTDVKTTRQAKAHLSALFPGVTPFDTPKPEQLIARIIEIATNVGDIVLDCFLGSGTTAAVSHKMDRRWVGVERSTKTLQAFILPRLIAVVAGDDPGGITEDIGWAGGGSFRILDVAPSMFEDDKDTLFLADWAVNNKLSEATAAQLCYAYDLDPPFCGRKGRSRLAVVDGLVNEGVVHLLASVLPEGERLAVYGTAVDDGAREAIRHLKPGSCVRKIPSALLAAYREERRWLVSDKTAERSTDVMLAESTPEEAEAMEVVTA